MIPDEHRRDLVRVRVAQKAPLVWFETIFGGGSIRHENDTGDVVDLTPEAATPLLKSGAVVKV